MLRAGNESEELRSVGMCLLSEGYSKALGESLGMERRFNEMIFLTSPLHDIGKIGIPEKVLLKRGPLTPEDGPS